MAYSCNPCDCVDQHYRSNDTFKKAVLTLLCDLLSGSSGGDDAFTEATFEPLIDLGPGDVGVAYSTAVNLPDGTRSVVFDNQMDGDVYVSMDDGTSDHYYIKSGQSMHLNLAEIRRVTTATIAVRDGSVASTDGLFFIYSIR